LRVTLLNEEHGNLSLRVEEVLHGDLPLEPGDVIEADRYDDKLACFVGCAAIEIGDQAFAFYGPTLPTLPPCAEREACVAACKGQQASAVAESGRSPCMCRMDPPDDFATITGSPTCGVAVRDDVPDCDDECALATQDVCPPRPHQDYKRGHVGLSPWTDPIVFARNERGELSLAREELDQLWTGQDGRASDDGSSCYDRIGDWTQLVPALDGTIY
jgi:hypothetical protein